jgi:hypothetical protein
MLGAQLPPRPPRHADGAKLDGLIERISPTHAMAVSFCNYDPPLFYGVFRAFFVGRN